MTIAQDDPRLTAYALDEMDDADKAAFEALLAQDESAKATVEDIAAMGALLAKEFEAEEGPGLSDERRAALHAEWATEPSSAEATAAPLAEPKPAKKSNVIRGPWVAAGTMMALAAGLVLVINTGGIPDESVRDDEMATSSAPSEKTAYDKGEATAGASADRQAPAQAAAAASTPADNVDDNEALKEAPAGRPERAQEAEEAELAQPAAAAPHEGGHSRAAGEKAARVMPGNPAPPAEGGLDKSKKKAEAEKDAPAPETTLRAVGGSDPKSGAAGGDDLFRGAAGDGSVAIGGGAPAKRPLVKTEAKAQGANITYDGKRKGTAGKKADKGYFGGEGRFKGLGTPAADEADNDGEREDSKTLEPPPQPLEENPFHTVAAEPLSTFSADVDTASYANVRRFLNRNTLPPASAVRVEEMLNYFDYAYAPPQANSDHPFAARVAAAQAPWNTKHRLVRVGIKGRVIERTKRPSVNLVFLLDVSGSMSNYNKLPLMKFGITLVRDPLGPVARFAVVTYAGESGVAVRSTQVDGAGKRKILKIVNGLQANGATNGSDGLRLAYEQAVLGFAEGGVNRVVLASDGDFNVGMTNRKQLEQLIAAKAKSGVFLTVLGVGMSSFKDPILETLADKGNGNYAYLDDRREVRKVLVDDMLGTLVTIAKDVKIQVEFNPAKVSAYRLIGYENRKLAAQDFRDDTKDAGEIGAGHTVTALYEVVPAGLSSEGIKLKYAAPTGTINPSPELLTVKLRYKQPTGSSSVEMEYPFVDSGARLSDADKDFQFATAVAGFGMILRGSKHTSNLTLETVRELAQGALGKDPKGRRKEFVQLVDKARTLRRR